MATCVATSTAPVRLRSKAESVGRMSRLMRRSSLALQVGGGGESPDAPCGIEPGGEGRRDREYHGPDDSDDIEMRQLLVAAALAEACRGIQVVHGDEPERCEREAEQGAEHRHHSDFDQQLSEDLPAARAERAAD